MLPFNSVHNNTEIAEYFEGHPLKKELQTTAYKNSGSASNFTNLNSLENLVVLELFGERTQTGIHLEKNILNDYIKYSTLQFPTMHVEIEGLYKLTTSDIENVTTANFKQFSPNKKSIKDFAKILYLRDIIKTNADINDGFILKLSKVNSDIEGSDARATILIFAFTYEENKIFFDKIEMVEMDNKVHTRHEIKINSDGYRKIPQCPDIRGLSVSNIYKYTVSTLKSWVGINKTKKSEYNIINNIINSGYTSYRFQKDII